MKPDLVIFDCDGVLVDSEPISISVLREMIRTAGHEIGEDVAYERFLGRSMASICAALADDPGIEITADQLGAMRERLNSRFRAELKAIDRVGWALQALPMARCVASSSKPERIALSLTVTGLFPLLDPHIYSATMVQNGKPAPDLFLHAAAQMGFPPEKCLVIEDSSAGVEAAKRAGMRVFAFTGATHARHPAHLERITALEPDLVFDNMADLPGLIGRQ
ncbi:HAD-IA family hydrolase [Aliihoeflea aestuarii]|jgi:HAD superfamily hydrolase (TIGR01509 family)|uniref:HAD family hydrolase n=1 Tax=Aliihoeflea aestuarii TaxID=453840 RepID=UPI002092F06C|nr:HAD family hydrolase [Aliihoeflea aestuarii]MCO6389624.1 HAD-IA family hydrolase [Aliihoeflea aestuarii]